MVVHQQLFLHGIPTAVAAQVTILLVRELIEFVVSYLMLVVTHYQLLDVLYLDLLKQNILHLVQRVEVRLLTLEHLHKTLVVL